MLTRSNTPKSGLSQNPSAGFKAIHNEFPSPKGLHLSPADITADSKCSGDSHTSGSEVHGEALESSPPHQQQSSIEATHTDVKMSATSTNRKDRASHLASKADGSPQSAASSSLLLPSPPTNSQSINFAHSASSSVTAVISRARYSKVITCYVHSYFFNCNYHPLIFWAILIVFTTLDKTILVNIKKGDI